MGWIITAVGIIFTIINPQVGLLIFVVGLIIAILSGTSSGTSAPKSDKPPGPFMALIILIGGAVIFMIFVSALVGAVASF